MSAAHPATLTDPARLSALRATGLLDTPASECLDRLARAAARLLGVRVALVSLVDDRWQRFAGLSGLTGPAAEQRGVPLSHSFCREVVATGEPLVVPDALADPRVRDNPAIGALGVAAYLGVPLTTAEGHTLGAMCAFADAPHAWSDDDLAGLQDLAAAVVGELTLRASLRHLEAQAALHEASVALNPQIPWVADAAGGTIDVSVRWHERTGVDAERSHGHGWLQAFHPDDVDAVQAAWRRAIATGTSYDVRHRLRTADGGYRWMRSRARPHRDGAGRVVNWFGWSEDVHDQVLGQGEQARFALAARGTVDGLWTWDFRDDAVFISPRYRQLLGCTEAEFPDAADAFFARVHPEDRPHLDAALRAHLETRVSFDLELRLRHQDGSWRWFWNRGQAEWDGDGRPLRMAGSVSDLTGWRAEQAARAASEARYRALLEAAYDGICSTDAAGVVTYANPRLEAMLGHAPGGLVGRPYFDLLDAAEVEPARVRFACLAERVADTRELTLRRADGSALPVLKATSALFDDTGTFTGALFILSDLTERRRTESSLRTSEARLAGIIGSAMDAIVTADATQRIVLANAAAERVFGYAPGTMLGRPIDALIPARLRARHGAHVRQFADDGTTTRAMGGPVVLAHEGIVGVRQDGTEFPIEASISQVATESGRFFTVILRDITQQRAAEAERQRVVAALRQSEERYALAARATRNAIWDWDLLTDAVAWNEEASGVLGYAFAEIGDASAWWLDRVHADDRQRVLQSRQAVIDDPDGAVGWKDRYRFRRPDGGYMEIEDHGYVARDAAGRAVRMVGGMADVTATRQLEERLRQAQKMEAVGQLAGGVAHDFNNLLTVITGTLEFLHADLAHELAPGHTAHADLAEIGQAADRARGLVRQLLTFSRRQPVRLQRVQLGAVVDGAERLLRRVIGEEIALAVHVDDGAWRVEADPGQLEQVLLNLAVNARDAMLTPLHGHTGRGGALTLEVDTVLLAASQARRWEGVAPGRWVRLRVRDTGHGMDAATQAHAFEPFFTTKAVGAGTGLGLATVFGIVRQAGGAIRADSAPGQGTTFTLLLPALPPGEGDAGDRTPEPVVPRTRATVLLVEDETPVRGTARRMLERRGYHVLEARHGGDALLVWQKHGDHIDVVVTDLRMPELGGRELLATLHAERPELPAVLMSGYAELDAMAVASPREAFVPKPFTADGLLTAVAAVLDAAR